MGSRHQETWMSPAPAEARLPRRLLSSLLALVVPVGLACSGLPVPGAISGGAADDAPGSDADEGDAGEGGVADAEPVPPTPPADPTSLFAALDPNEAPPFERGTVKCPPGTMVVNNPKGNRLTVFCMTNSGVRSGPYTEWQGRKLLVSAANVDGKLDGVWSRWEKAGDETKKVEHQVYVGGVATGDHAVWDPTGTLLVRGRMVDGRKDGLFLERATVDGKPGTGGACYAAGTEVWRTTDDAELATRECSGTRPAEAPAEAPADAQVADG
jgi:hypothetical protein